MWRSTFWHLISMLELASHISSVSTKKKFTFPFHSDVTRFFVSWICIRKPFVMRVWLLTTKINLINSCTCTIEPFFSYSDTIFALRTTTETTVVLFLRRFFNYFKMTNFIEKKLEFSQDRLKNHVLGNKIPTKNKKKKTKNI